MDIRRLDVLDTIEEDPMIACKTKGSKARNQTMLTAS